MKKRFTRAYTNFVNKHIRVICMAMLVCAFVGAMWFHPLYWLIMGYGILHIVFLLTWYKKYLK